MSFSKTSMNGLNFLKKDEEINLLKKDQSDKIIDIFRYFYLLLNEKFEDLPKNKIIENFMLTILSKLKVENLSEFNI